MDDLLRSGVEADCVRLLVHLAGSLQSCAIAISSANQEILLSLDARSPLSPPDSGLARKSRCDTH